MGKVMPCEVYSRIVGYFRPLHNWNVGKKQEFVERVEFSEKISMKAADDSYAAIDAIKVFTFPDCHKCESIKEYLKDKDISKDIINLKTPEGNKEFRKFYANQKVKDSIKRLEGGTLQLPVVLFMRQGSVVSTAQSLDETKAVLA
ncbi:MAG TPA: anaerobic ribonucleoside-triphosphate reductase [Candidatus Nanoarchaeia archaeon]|nr:anaerobic ribonucleoside-triphosphate reductase [Candidatus Nanoarchaeia archaeon]